MAAPRLLAPGDHESWCMPREGAWSGLRSGLRRQDPRRSPEEDILGWHSCTAATGSEAQAPLRNVGPSVGKPALPAARGAGVPSGSIPFGPYGLRVHLHFFPIKVYFRIILHLQESCKTELEGAPVCPSPTSPSVTLSPTCRTGHT